ncbi:MAG TPA: hypothetical protein VJY33_03640 [Isosphaeraceae bacterium]|nr:hypothetical protein [Isosphaeraceae bacterium]
MNIDEITDRAHGRFGPRIRESINRDDVRKVLAELNLAKVKPARKVPRLMLNRLRFKGMKTIDEVSTPIDYDQPFDTGVNVVVIEDNLVGKSSILKTIKFALTGSDEEYDQSVREWIREIWLEFSLDDRRYTMMLARREDGLHGRLVPGQYSCPIEEVPKEDATKGFYHRGEEEIQQALDSFFVHEFGLESLGWNMASPARDGTSSMAWASWKTYFLALRIPDDNHTYFICKPEAANQEQLIFSAFLGLHLGEPINRLSMEVSSLNKATDYDRERQAEQDKRRSELLERQSKLRQDLAAMDAEQSERLKPLTDGALGSSLIAAQGEMAENASEILEIKEQSENLATQLRQFRAVARRLREQIDLSRELTGLQVSLCPNCARPIDEAAVEREKASHQCRLCVKPVPAASEDEAAILEAEAKRQECQAEGIAARLAKVNHELEVAWRKGVAIQSRVDSLRTTIRESVSTKLPTQEESERRGKLHEEIGEINYELKSLEQLTLEFNTDRHANRIKILKKVWEVVKDEADERNQEIVTRLNELAKDVIVALGAEQITGIKCHPTGVVKLTKNGADISFSKIMNPGERYRAKLALFLAMMRLGCEAGIGKHPGFLMLDQLGGAEMVPEDLKALAAALRRIEQEFSDRVQIICFTAKPEFREATVPSKVYGHQGKVENGKKYAF